MPHEDRDQPLPIIGAAVRATELAHPAFPLPAAEFRLTPPPETVETQPALTFSEPEPDDDDDDEPRDGCGDCERSHGPGGCPAWCECDCHGERDDDPDVRTWHPNPGPWSE